jgi:hypothetical protein
MQGDPGFFTLLLIRRFQAVSVGWIKSAANVEQLLSEFGK